MKKGGFVSIDKVTSDAYYTLMPEYYIRPYEPNYVDKKELERELSLIQSMLNDLNINSVISDIKNGKFSFAYTKYQATDKPISEVITYMSGNSGLTEEFIYHSLQHIGKRYTVLSSATEERTLMGQVPMCKIANKPLKVFEGREGLLVTRNGKAGRTRFLEKGNYTINDHAYILYVKDDCPYKINLKWLLMQYKKDFLMFSSSSDNGTWNMTGFFKSVRIDIPDYEEQMAAVNIWDKLLYAYEKIQKINNVFVEVFEKQIYTE